MALYFLALVPEAELRARVKTLKEEMSEGFQARHALKSPAHITLQMPFKRPQAEEQRLIDQLASFAGQQSAFPVQLSGFDCFAPRVIYIRISDHRPVRKLYDRLRSYLLKEMGFSEEEVNARFHPHMTIATRDLRKAAFREAWAVFENRAFEGAFTAGSLFLLKHNGRHWELFQEFEFDQPAGD